VLLPRPGLDVASVRAAAAATAAEIKEAAGSFMGSHSGQSLQCKVREQQPTEGLKKA
jgi:hypothetical protein